MTPHSESSACRQAPSRDDADDLRLIEAVAAGDQRALRSLMDRYMPRIVALAERILGLPHEADDVAQETFIRVWRHAGRFDYSGRRARFSTWLHAITVNLCIDRQRRAHGNWQPIDESLPDTGAEPGTVAEQQQLRTQLAQGMMQLSIRHRAALILHYIDDLSAREAAEVMNLSEKGFESLVLRARRALREKLDLASFAR